jgi:hypothetical protein
VNKRTFIHPSKHPNNIQTTSKHPNNIALLVLVLVTMFAARRLLNPTKYAAKSAAASTQRRAKSSTPVSGFLYNNVWMKSTPLYIGYIFAGAVVVELFFGFATDAIFDTINKGVSCYFLLVYIIVLMSCFLPHRISPLIGLMVVAFFVFVIEIIPPLQHGTI